MECLLQENYYGRFPSLSVSKDFLISLVHNRVIMTGVFHCVKIRTKQAYLTIITVIVYFVTITHI